MGNKMTKQEHEAKEQKEQKKSPFQKLLARFQMCPNKPDKWSTKKVNADTKVPAAPPKPPLRIHAERLQLDKKEQEKDNKITEWTEVSLQVPEYHPENNRESELKTIPVPPPRKHKLKIHELLQSPKKSNNIEAEVTTSRIPVEEPIIIPKKVVEHVCDGTHHHVHNVINGKVVDQIVEHTKKEKQVKSDVKIASTLSLPSYDDTKKKDVKRSKSPTKSSKKNSSASSLPIDKKNKSINSAAEKLESYMIRCRSIGSIIPHQKTDKHKAIKPDSDNESVDSWGGLDDWDLGIIEHDVSQDMPNPSLKKLPKANISNTVPEKEKLSIKDDVSNNYVLNKTKENVPHIYPEGKEVNEAGNKTTALLPIGSYPFKNISGKSAFENDAFFTTEFLKYECQSDKTDVFPEASQVKLAPLAAFDSDKESEKDGNFDIYESCDDNKKSVAFILNNDSQSPNKNLENIEEVHPINSGRNEGPKATPRRKSSSGHSKLLKFINNTLENKDTDQTQSKMFDIKNNQIKNTIVEATVPSEDIEEPEIIPQLRNVDRSWQRLIKSDEVTNAPFLDQESSISDLIETSSDDTRSTTIEAGHK